MKEFEEIDISGDIGLRVHGKSPEELFEHAAKGLYALIAGNSTVAAGPEREICIEYDAWEDTLVRWLNELIFLFDTEGFIGRDIAVTFHGRSLRAGVTGGVFNPAVHECRLLIKAATYHGLSVQNRGNFWEATVIFDI